MRIVSHVVSSVDLSSANCETVAERSRYVDDFFIVLNVVNKDENLSNLNWLKSYLVARIFSSLMVVTRWQTRSMEVECLESS